jgi:hypothetical protein
MMSLSKDTILKLGTTVFLIIAFVLGFINSPDIAKVVMPNHFWSTREYWNQRQHIYAERSVDYVNETIEFLQDLRENPEMLERMGLHPESVFFAIRKETARSFRAMEKKESLSYTLARIREKQNALRRDEQ